MSNSAGKIWQIKTPTEEEIIGFSEATGLSELYCHLLLNRGIDNKEEAIRFLNPDLNDLHDPFLMQDMDKATERIAKAIQLEEKIMIYGDYDVDGTTSVALVFNVLSSITDRLITYIPDRYKEGYGISIEGMDKANSEGCKLVIALDCGITAIDQIGHAVQQGLDVIVCDHHLPHGELPACICSTQSQTTG